MNRSTPLIVAGLIALGGLAGYGVAQLGSGPAMAPATAKKAGEKEILYWVAPMDPSYRREGPGKSPMGMDLIPVYAEDASAGSSAGAVTIDPRIVNDIGVRTVTAARRDLTPTIQTVGRIAYDDKGTSHVHVRAPGWVEKLYVRAAGETVKAGAPLFDVYSPELITAQAEYLQALGAGRQGLAASAKDRLLGLGLTPADIDQLAARKKPIERLTVRAPISGTVTMLNIVDAARLMPGGPALTIVDLSKVWLIADVFESDMAAMRLGATIKARADALGDLTVEGTVEHVYPDLNPTTRTVPVRVVLENPEGRFRPGMFLTVTIDRQAIPDALTVPSTAVIRLGSENHVLIAEGEGKFRPAKVTLGEEAEGLVEIKSGLDEGEQVVVAGQFMIDAESSFQGAAMRMASPKEEEAEAVETETYVRGTVNSVDMAGRTLNVSHDAVDAIGWPAMTMDFPVIDDVDLAEVREGAMIHFGIGKRQDGRYVITLIHVMGAM